MYQYIALGAWALLPSMATSVVQAIYYAVTVRGGAAKPAPGTARHKAHRDTIHVLLALALLTYAAVEAHLELRQTPTLFAELGLPASASEREIRAHFRRIAAQHHPDKVGADADAAAADRFVTLQSASKTLQDATRRFVYERFGPDALDWEPCATTWDFVCWGLLYAVLPYYGATATVVLGVALVAFFTGGGGGGGNGLFYRGLLLASMAVLEMYVVTSGPALPPPLALLNRAVGVVGLPPYLPFEVVHFARRVALTAYFALSQMMPIVLARLGLGADGSSSSSSSSSGPLPPAPSSSAPAAAKTPPPKNAEIALVEQLIRLEIATKELDKDAAGLIDLELTPFRDDPRMAGRIHGKMREWLVANTVHADPVVKDALGSSMRRTRVRHAQKGM